MKTQSHHAPPKPLIADAILLLLSDERERSTGEIHDFVKRNGISDHLRSTAAALDAMRFNLVSDRAPYRVRRRKAHANHWRLESIFV